jgi:hypothetical protein
LLFDYIGICPTPNLEDHARVFRFPSKRAARLYPQTLGSLFVAFYVSQGLHTGIIIYNILIH